jgi:RND superfamily putative drug exporter
MLERLAELVVRRARQIVILAILVGIGAAAYGAGVAHALASGGFEVKDGEAARLAELLQDRFGHAEPDLVALLQRNGESVGGAEAQADLRALVEDLRADPRVRSVDAPLGVTTGPLVSRDRATALLAIEVGGSATEKEAAYPEIAARLHGGSPQLTVAITGPLALAAVGQETAEHDLQRGELVAFPVVGVILLVFFRGRIATLLPLVVGALAIAFATASLRALALVTDISIFSLNIVTLLGLGLAIDYSLFIVQRFREELSHRDPAPAVVASVKTAGKTMLFSGVAVGVSLLGLLAFPIALLHSIAIAGALIVLLTVLASLTVLPALLVLLGHRIEWPHRKRAPTHGEPGRRWARLAEWVMRRPGLFAIMTTAILLGLGSPVLRLSTGLSDARMFPPDAEVRVAQDMLDAPAGFAEAGTVRYVAMVTAPRPILDATTLGELYDANAALIAEPDVADVQGLVSALGVDDRARFVMFGSALAGRPMPAGLERLVDGDATLVTIIAEHPLDAPSRAEQIDRLRGILGRDFEVAIGGYGKTVAEVDDELSKGLVPAVVVVVLATIVVLTLAFGAILVSLKAVVMNVISLSASFGALVWVFQDGRFQQTLHYTSAGAIDPLILVIMFAIVFGLSMDYELFLLSRIREAWDQTHDPTASVAVGLAATGRLFTMAALMLIVVLLGFGSGHLAFVKQLGLGMALAIAIDATIVRALLVPATMRLLGRWNWWAPRRFERWWRESGIGVHEGSVS